MAPDERPLSGVRVQAAVRLLIFLDSLPELTRVQTAWGGLSDSVNVIVSAGGLVYLAGSASRSAILTNSARELASILRIAFPRWIFTVISLIPTSAAICLFNSPVTTRCITSRSRGVKESNRPRRLANSVLSLSPVRAFSIDR